MVVPELYLLNLERFLLEFDRPVVLSLTVVCLPYAIESFSKIGMVVPELYLLDIEPFLAVFDGSIVLSLAKVSSSQVVV